MTVTPLPNVERGAGVITSIDVDPRARRRLAELGIRPGSRVGIVRRTTGGAVIVEAEGSRIALDHRTAAAVQVEQP